MGCTSCDHGRADGITAVKIVVLARSDADLRRLIEPLADDPLLRVQMAPAKSATGESPVLLARLTLADDLLLYLLGALYPTPPSVLRDLASGAIGAVIADSTLESGGQPALGGLPSVVTPSPGGLVPTQPVHGHRAREQAKRPFTDLLRAAISGYVDADARQISPPAR